MSSKEIIIVAIDYTTYDETRRQAVLRKFTELGWDNAAAFGITAGGAQFCRLDGLTEAASAPGNHRDRLLTHWQHAVIAHPEEMFSNASSNRTTAATAG